MIKQQQREDAPTEHLSRSVDRVTFLSEETGFYVLRVKVKGKRDLITVIGSAASIAPGEFVDCLGMRAVNISVNNRMSMCLCKIEL